MSDFPSMPLSAHQQGAKLYRTPDEAKKTLAYWRWAVDFYDWDYRSDCLIGKDGSRIFLEFMCRDTRHDAVPGISADA